MIYNILQLISDRKEFFLSLLIEHLVISLVSITIAVVLGLVIGILLSEYQKISKVTLSIINLIYTVPSISLLGFLIPFSGIGNTTAIIALTVYALLPMVRNTYTGITHIDQNILEAAKGMGSTKVQILMKMKIPLAMPVIMSGIRNMVTMTIALAGIASFIGAGGLGVAIYRGITTNNPAMTITGSLLIALLALVIDFILGFVESKLFRRRGDKKKSIIIFTATLILFIGGIIFSIVIGNLQKKDTINIATKPMTEQYILGEIMSLLIENNTDLQVNLTQGVGGGTSNIQPAMEKGEFDIYPEYTGTAWNTVLKKDGLYSEEMFPDLVEEYKEKYQMTWSGLYGFNNTYGLVVRKQIAEEYNLKTYSDLAKVSDHLIFGAEYDFFEREDGYDDLASTYGYRFMKTMDLDIGLKYQAINRGTIDVMNVFITDGQLSTADVVVLEDDLQFYPSYRCGNVIREEILAEHPELLDIFQKLESSITDIDMSVMNYQVESEGKEPREVAKDFLESHNLL